MYTINENDGYLEVQDGEGNFLVPDELRELADWLIRSANRKAIAVVDFTMPDQLTLIGDETRKTKKKKVKTQEQIDEDLRVTKYVKELQSVIAELNGVTDKDIIHGAEGKWAKRIAQSPEKWTIDQVKYCFKWIRSGQKHKRRITLFHIFESLPTCREYGMKLKAQRSGTQDKVYAAVEQGYDFE